ncbi:MAG: esterase-like activity of phytase family protein [Paracoccus sp. (in: a-proteobacteria)]|uniref:esterase-like activity of phytase family protein n=1 Tax=Paracoccus sp. TaxID=267 RepID=UPI0026DED710|nr:esterase-like activity of phytase family protein [Paracoccus sp. (in: a-proteobacteria)]MDO5620306.1 esterase-like activity of phytase family protein [Paracoccus sp. (in: a-proteobacteria)]
MLRLTLCSVLALAAAPAVAEPVFNRISSFPTIANMAAGEDQTRETSAEIITATEDGNTLIYSDSPLGVIGLIDITDPRAPKPLGNINVDGEPTTTVVIGGMAFVGVNTSESYANPSGALRSVNIADQTITASCDLGGQPDSVARNAEGTLLAVAIENERDEDAGDGGLPQMPAGFVVTIPVVDGQADCANLRKIDVTGLADVGGEDPEPEFLAFNSRGDLAVTLQENNHIVIIGADGQVSSHFNAGSVDLDQIDTKRDGQITPTESLTNIPREPDAIGWLTDDLLVAANEGDWKGGSRGFSVWDREGNVVHDSGAELEHWLMRLGHYPDKRSDKKGGEPESVLVAEYDGQKYLFVASERGSVIFVYAVAADGSLTPLQALPSGISPEGMVAIPGRNLFASANEADLGDDGAARAHVMIYERSEAAPAYPSIEATDLTPWGALSGLATDPADATRLYAVSDSYYAAAPAIFTIDASQTPAQITGRVIVTRDGKPAEKLDLEGITSDGQGGFWLASEGNPEKEIPNLVLHVDASGAIQQEIALPDSLIANATRFGLEGITLVDGKLWLAVQRDWKDDAKGQTKLLQLDPATGEWAGVRYPLDSGEGWVGLSEITAHDGYLYLIERDNQIGDKAVLKAITRVSLDGLIPAPLDGDLPLVAKETVRDLIPDLKSTGGYVLDKVEGLAITPDGTAYVVTDNDGVDDSSGETMFWSFKL